jgi:hypothetical protein
MVLVLRFEHLKFRVNAKDHNPPHVHVEAGGARIRINLLTLDVLDERIEFSPRLTAKVLQIVEENRELLLEKWMEYHG